MASKVTGKTRNKGAGSIIKDGKRFYLKVVIAGKAKSTMLRNTKGEPVTNRPDAEAAAETFRATLYATSKEEIALHVAEAKKLRKQSGLLLALAWETYLKQPNRPASAEATLKNHRGIFELFLRWVADERPGISRVTEVDADVADAYFADLWNTGISAKRYNDEILSLRLIFRHLAKPAALDSNPFDGIAKKPLEVASRHEFTPEQVDAIFNGFTAGFFYDSEVEKLTTGRKRERVVERLQYHPLNAAEMRVLLNMCCWTGCRGQDGCLMQWRNVNLSTGQISYIPRKTARKTNHRAVTLPMHPALRGVLLDAQQWRDSNRDGEDYILPAVADRYQRNPSGIQKDVMKIIRCATGLETTSGESFGRRKLAANAYSLHSFRHTFVSFCANAGVPLAIVAEIVGHGNPAMTRHYSHITTEAKRGAIDALPMIGAGEGVVVLDGLVRLRQRVISAVANADEEVLKRVLDILEVVR